MQSISFFSVYCYATNGIATLFNIILLLISSHKNVEAIRELRYFLSNIAVASIVFSACVLLLQPQMITRGSMNIRLIHGPLKVYSESMVKSVASIAVVSYLYATLSFPLFFIYRSMVLANNTMFGQYFTRKNLIFIFALIFVFCCFEGAALHFSCIPYKDLYDRLDRSSDIIEKLDNETMSRALANNNLLISNSGNAGIVATNVNELHKANISLFGDDYKKNPLILIFHAISLFVHSMSYIIILICAHYMLKLLRKKQATMSQDTYSENEVLVHTVFAEAFVPLLLSVPVAANALLTYFYENSLVWQEFLPTCFMSLVPLFSGTLCIFFIQPYRQSLLDFLTFKKCRGNRAQAIQNAIEEES